MTALPASASASASALPASPRAEAGALPVWVWPLWTLAVMAAAACLPFDASYDVLHYHIHNGWAAAEGRLDTDWAPAWLHSYTNPAHSLFIWHLIERLPGPLANALLALPAALTAPLLFTLSQRFARLVTGESAPGLALLAALLGAVAEGQLGVLGSLRNDSWGAAAFLAALVLAMRADGRLAGAWGLFAASGLLGAMLGMKLTNFPYAIGLAVFVCVLARGWGERVRGAAICAAAGGAGALLLAGPFAWVLWERFANPVHPLLGSWFDSPAAPDGYDAYARRKMPLISLPAFPLLFTWDSTIIGSADAKDPRFLLAYGGAGALLWRLRVLWQRRGEASLPEWARPVLALGLAVMVMMFVWMGSVPVLRYMMAAWLLGPVLALLAVQAWTGRAVPGRRAGAGLAALGALTLATTAVPGADRVAWGSWDARYTDGALPLEPAAYEDGVVLFPSTAPTAFLAPLFPDSAVRVGTLPEDYFEASLANDRHRGRARIDAALEAGRPVWVAVHALPGAPGWTRGDVLESVREAEGLRAAGGAEAACGRVRTVFDRAQNAFWVCRSEAEGE